MIPDDAHVIVVSDHGAQCMEGGIALNEWLIQQGLPRPAGAARRRRRGSRALKIDWSRTTAWGSGGYYGRLFLNVKGREPQGLIPPEDYEATRDRLVAELEALGDPAGPADRDPRAQARASLPDRPRRSPARPVRLLRRPPLALGRHRRHRRRSTPSRTTPAPTTPTTRPTAC